MKILTFIPARGGSRSIKNKNIIKINNKPLITHTIDFVKKFPKMDWFVSTDNREIFKIVKKKGFKFNYIRSKKISGPKSNIVDSIIHGVNWLKKNYNINYDTVALLQPTSPLRNKKEFRNALNYFKKKNLESLASVTIMREHPEECVEIKNNKKWNFLKKRKKNVYGRQNFSRNFYFIDGSYYIAKIRFLKKNKNFLKKNKTFFYKLNNKWPVDIDEKDDLALCNLLLKNKKDLKIIQRRDL